jgi:2'-5' RNA ligase
MSDQDRLFFALWPDLAVRRGLAALQEREPRVRGRPTHPEDLHLTLVFLGEMDAARRRCAEQTADAVRIPSFDLQLDQLGYWSRPRIFWCGARLTPEPLIELVQRLQAGLGSCAVERERRPYAAHITLARDAHPVPALDLTPVLHWPVREFVLVASRRGGPPPHYQLLRRWDLAVAGSCSEPLFM